MDIGKHRVVHGSIMDGIDDLMQGQKADLMYSDPPWGQGNVKYWYTMNKKMTGEVKQPPELNDFINMIFFIAQNYVSGHVFVEYGTRWREYIKSKARRFGLKDIATFCVFYKSSGKLLPLDLHIFSHKDLKLPEGYAKLINGTCGYTTVKNAVFSFASPKFTILDPCCGMGYTARVAMETGMAFRGKELNSKRLEKTIARLNK